MQVGTVLTFTNGERLGSRVMSFGFFRSVAETGYPYQAALTTEFVAENAHWICYQLELELDSRLVPLELAVWTRYSRVGGVVMGEFPTTLLILPNWSRAYLQGRLTLSGADFWLPGEYLVELFSGGTLLVREQFRIVPRPPKPTSTELGFFSERTLRSPAGHPYPLQWSFVKEQRPLISAWVSLSFEPQNHPQRLPVYLFLTHPDGHTTRLTTEVDVEVGASRQTLEFSLGQPTEWLTGTYRIHLSMGDKRITQTTFELMDWHDVESARPDALLPLELELRALPPRTAPWVTVVNQQEPSEIALLRGGHACQGWVVSVVERNGYVGDPDYAIVFAYELNGEVHVAFARVQADALHWGLGQPLSLHWFERNVRRKMPVTVLVSASGEAAIYGCLDPYLLGESHAHWAAGALGQ